jgi:hypothetical protein
LGAFALVLLCIAAGAFWVSRKGPGECTNTVSAEHRSPGGQWMAAVFARRCGDGETTQVALRRAGSAFEPASGLADDDVVFIAAGREALKLSWTPEPEALVIETRAGTLAREVHQWRKLGVTVRRVR